jgi:hypothetical protein
VLEAHPEVLSVGEVEGLAAKRVAQCRDADDPEAMMAGICEMEAEIAKGEPGIEGNRTFHALNSARRVTMLSRRCSAPSKINSPGSFKRLLPEPDSRRPRWPVTGSPSKP